MQRILALTLSLSLLSADFARAMAVMARATPGQRLAPTTISNKAFQGTNPVDVQGLVQWLRTTARLSTDGNELTQEGLYVLHQAVGLLEQGPVLAGKEGDLVFLQVPGGEAYKIRIDAEEMAQAEIPEQVATLVQELEGADSDLAISLLSTLFESAETGSAGAVLADAPEGTPDVHLVEAFQPGEAPYLKTTDEGQSIGVKRIEHFGRQAHEVLDVSAYVEEKAAYSDPSLQTFLLEDVFAEPMHFLGFGRPNVYLNLPQADGSDAKFAAKSLRRAPSKIVDTKGKVQSGLLVVFKNLPAKAKAAIQAAAEEREGTKNRTCVAANCMVLAKAGFTVGGKRLDLNRGRTTWPMPMLQSILKDGIEFEGQKIEFDLVRTAPQSANEFRYSVDRAVRNTPARHAGRAAQGDGFKAKLVRGIGTVWRLLTFWYPRKKENAPSVEDKPVRWGKDAHHDYTVEIANVGRIGAALRKWWGAHVLFRVRQHKVNVGSFLPVTLKPFPKKNPDFVTRLKKHVLFNRFMIGLIRWQLARNYQVFPAQSDKDLFDMMEAPVKGKPVKYNIVLHGNAMEVMKIDGRSKVPDWILSKHVLIANYSDDVRFAGEVWKGADGKIHLSNDSGTYKPSNVQLEQAILYLMAVFPAADFVGEPAA